MVEYHDKEVQVSDTPQNDYNAMDNVLESIKLFPGKVSLRDFLQRLFAKPGEADSRSWKHAQAVSRFMISVLISHLQWRSSRAHLVH